MHECVTARTRVLHVKVSHILFISFLILCLVHLRKSLAICENGISNKCQRTSCLNTGLLRRLKSQRIKGDLITAKVQIFQNSWQRCVFAVDDSFDRSAHRVWACSAQFNLNFIKPGRQNFIHAGLCPVFGLKPWA
jgi:hypothetical protein